MQRRFTWASRNIKTALRVSVIVGSILASPTISCQLNNQFDPGTDNPVCPCADLAVDCLSSGKNVSGSKCTLLY